MKRALLLAPLLLFLACAFLAPVAAFLWRSVQDDAVAPALPRTLAALRDWDGRTLPGDAAFAALAQDLRAARDTATLAPAAARLNLDIAGLRGVLARTAQALPQTRAALLKFDPAWGTIETWGAIHRARGRITDFNLLAALDLKRDATGAIRSEPAEQVVFRSVLLRTFEISALVTLLCLLLGYPVAALLALLPARWAGLLTIAVLLPFWTGVIVRSAAWMALLGHDGPVASLIGIVTAPPPLLFTRAAVILAMTHIQLPFMVLPLLAVMRHIPRLQWRAAASLGGGPLAVFTRIWLPQTAPGIAAGALLVFLPCLGFFVTPALLGGGADQMLAFLIGDAATHAGNWPLAAALSVVLLAATLALALLAARPARTVLAHGA